MRFLVILILCAVSQVHAQLTELSRSENTPAQLVALQEDIMLKPGESQDVRSERVSRIRAYWYDAVARGLGEKMLLAVTSQLRKNHRS